MSELVPVLPDELLNPVTGELVPVTDIDRVAEAIVQIDEIARTFRDAKAAFTEAVIAESQRQGTQTLDTAHGKLSLSSDTRIVWDHHELLKLIDAGLPEDRWDALVKVEVTYRVDRNVVRQLEGASEAYAEIIDRARTREPATRYVTVK